ncbi:phosphatase [Leuconostoc litchii]|uniref:Phosphatase PAP2 family protein n=1 Tax=Leuconostoc litchii TaxID=1981069 RepID=A0A6P2CTS5_9LACO|nr:phosphatase PAP2 family protein [Leuconostoc litchii]TYC47647.1 phosphatase PAP2 family protein [Leuconostoc litchii]GMA69695.1 phosphatase [Leuconostoc litchii]
MIISVKNKQLRHAIIYFIAVIILALSLKINFLIPSLDNAIHSFTTGIQNNLNDAIMTVFSFLGSPIVDIIYILILTGVLILANLRIPAIWSISTIILGYILNSFIRLIVARTRPVGHLLSDQGSSFPSSHVFGIFSVIFILFLVVIPNIESYQKRILISWGIILVGVMNIMSRMYFNANYFTDTVAAILLAYSWVILAGKLYPILAKYLISLPFFSHDEI